MTNETRERIKVYKRALPGMRERVVAVAILLAMSISMIVSASFAWITLSRAPEITGMQTTVAANGNLEIALAQGYTKDALVVPQESQIGDSSATEGQTIVGANITWGNLVNVSDPTYGISNIALRPALLSAYNRKDYPLNGATYGGDGRVVTTNDRYGFTSYAKVDGSDTEYYFAAGDKVTYGVRAISSIGYKNVTGNVRIDQFRKDTEQLYRDAQSYYGKIVSASTNEVNTLNAAAGVTCISALEGLVTVFAQDEVNSMGLGPSGTDENSKTSCSPYIWYFYQMVLLLQEALNKEGKALLEMANWQAYVESGDAKTEKTFASLEDLLGASKATLTSKGVTLSTLENYKKSVSELKTCVNGIKPMAEKCKNPAAPEEDYYWEDIATYVNTLVHINTTSMNGVELQNAGSMTNAMKILGGGDVIVKKGTLVDIETRLVDNSNRVAAKVKVTVNTSLLGKKTVDGTVYTAAQGKETSCSTDLAYSSTLESGALGDATAKDTYGLALDVWVRTNYPGAILTLEGSAIYEDRRATITLEGTEYNLSTISRGEGDAQIELDVYEKNGKWYYADTSVEVTSDELGGQTPKEKYIPVVVGYEGENRVWEDWREMLESGYIQQDATTQGAGSCFVFYASTPTEQAKIMELLEAFNVAFMDQNGEILGTAKLSLGSAYANQGKVTVPLEMETGVEYTDELGMTHKGVTSLSQNTPKLITAIVYLNGSKLANENVLSNGELQGQLNIQFGTDSTLIAPNDEDLQAQYRSITAEVTVNGQTISNGTIGGTEGLEYKASGYKAKVTLNVEGERPERISGYFVRVINNTQGTRGEEKYFTYNVDSGKWEAEFTLTNPGTYAFNTLLVDGVQYTLHDGSELSGLNQYYAPNRPYVYIQGLKISSATVGVSTGTHMTAERSMEFPVTVKLEAAITPQKVNAQFFNANNTKQYTAILTYDRTNDQWVGSATINSSDTYTLKYISVDGDTYDAPSTGSYTLYLGLTASVSAGIPASDWRYMYDETQTVQIPVSVQIFDDGYNQIKNLSGIMLYYNNIISPAGMTWTGNKYEGVLDATNAGDMTFEKLVIGSVGTITNVSDAPVFTAVNTRPPAFVSGTVAPDKVNVVGGEANAIVTLEFTNGQSATVWAKMENRTSGEVVYIKGSHNAINQNKVLVKVPGRDGVWTVTELYLQNCFDTDENWYDDTGVAPTAEDSVVFTMSAESQEAMKTDVVASYSVAVYYDIDGDGVFTANEKQEGNNTFNLTGTKENPSGILLNGYAPNKIGVVILDYAGRSIDGITGTDQNADNKWVIHYTEGSSLEYGGYTGASVAKTIDAKFNLEENVKIGDVTYASMLVTETVTLYHSGVYTVTLQVNPGVTAQVLTVSPKFTIATIRPYVKFTATNPSVDTSFDVAMKKDDPQKADVKSMKNVISSDGYSVTCYYKSKNDGCDCTGFDPSAVTAGLFGAGQNFASATCTIVSKGTANNVVFTFEKAKLDANGNVYNEQTFGKSGETRTYLGTDAEATQLVIVTSAELGGQTLTFELVHPLKATLEY